MCLFVFLSKMPVQCFSDVNLYITRILSQHMLIVIWKFQTMSMSHLQVIAWCSKAHPRSRSCVKGHIDSVDVSGGAGASPELKTTERKDNISNICIYVPLFSNI